MNVNADVTRLLSILAQTNTNTRLPPPAPPAPPPPAPHSRPQFPPAVDPRLHGSLFQQPPAPIPVAPAAVVDPKNITDWPAALKYVMNTIYRNEEIMAQVKKMKRHQHDHEKQWWVAREELVRKHETRVESSKKVAELLKKLGTMPTATRSNLPTPESEKEELRVFDQKVHTRSEEMVKHMASEFAAMGIPFFCRASLPEKGDAELQALRKRVVELLEDLCEGE
ncbi:hypothetical protein DFP73DRAFT_532784 [Morchella snyderi]|nr:hypothetical protein DFP73DRAFT_532784 [Morchella snyderi]